MSMTTEYLHGTCTIMPGGKRPENRVNELLHDYLKLVQQQKLGWTEHLRLRRVVGKGGGGGVFFSERRGGGNFSLPGGPKFFFPPRFSPEGGYPAATGGGAPVHPPGAHI